MALKGVDLSGEEERAWSGSCLDRRSSWARHLQDKKPYPLPSPRLVSDWLCAQLGWRLKWVPRAHYFLLLGIWLWKYKQCKSLIFFFAQFCLILPSSAHFQIINLFQSVWTEPLNSSICKFFQMLWNVLAHQWRKCGSIRSEYCICWRLLYESD